MIMSDWKSVSVKQDTFDLLELLRKILADLWGVDKSDVSANTVIKKALENYIEIGSDEDDSGKQERKE